MMQKVEWPCLVVLLFALAAPLGAVTDRPLKSLTTQGELPNKTAKDDVIFVVAGDNRPTAQGAPLPRVLGTIVSEISLIRPDLVLWTGDTVYGYCDTHDQLEEEYRKFRQAVAPLAGVVPLFNVPGNHEIHSDQTTCSQPVDQLCWSEPDPGNRCSEKVYRHYFGGPYGSFSYAGAHFIALDTNVPGEEDAIKGTQLRWLKDDLKRNRNARAIFLFSHTEFFSSPLIDPPAGRSHPSIARRWELTDLFERYPVAAVFSGHEHLYWHEPPEKHDFIDYFVAGGAGAPFYAPPDRGGFAHYLLVRLSGGKPSYQLIEPGRLYTEPVQDPPAGTAQFWIVNSNEGPAIPLHGVEVVVPASLGTCDSLDATGQFRNRDAWTSFDIQRDSCEAAADGSLRLRFTASGMPQGSALVTVRRKS